VEGVQLIKRICGHESPFTFKKNERYGRQRYAKFMATKCPALQLADIQAREAQQKGRSEQPQRASVGAFSEKKPRSRNRRQRRA